MKTKLVKIIATIVIYSIAGGIVSSIWNAS